jgi:hypothetical protein
MLRTSDIMKNEITIAIAIIALAIVLAIATTAVQMVFAQTGNSEAGSTSTDQLIKNCKHGNAYACGKLKGDEAQIDPKTGTIKQCQDIPNEPTPCVPIRVN